MQIANQRKTTNKKEHKPPQADNHDENTDWKTGWNEELGLGWRMPKGAKESAKELSLAPNLPADGALDDAKMMVPFLDGTLLEVPITNKAFRDYKFSTQCVGKPLFESEHKITHCKVTLRQRTDRRLLISMYRQSKQVMQIRAGLFADLPDVPKGKTSETLPLDHPAIQKAIEFYEPLIKKFCADELVDKKELYQARDDRMKELGLGVKKKATSDKKKRKKKR